MENLIKCGACDSFGQNRNQLLSAFPDIKKAVDNYITEVNNNYNHVSSSTDFKFYDDENVKVFAKELKEYDGVTLEYIGIMPKKETLKSYINNLDTTKVNNVITNLKDISLNSFDDGYVTIINGCIPMFNFDYNLDLQSDLSKLGVTDVFDATKADLSNLTTESNIFVEVSHKATIDFSNEGIKAAAVTVAGGLGDVTFDIYQYEVPVKKIDLTFNNPFLYLIRNKNTGEVWFTGTVYEPSK